MDSKVPLAQTLPTLWTNPSAPAEGKNVKIHSRLLWENADSPCHKVTPKVMLSPTEADLSEDIMPTDVLPANMFHAAG